MCWVVWWADQMFRKTHLVLGKDLDEQLTRTLRAVGSFPLAKFLQKEQFKTTPKIQLHLSQFKASEFHWEALLDSSNSRTVDSLGLDLMRQMLNSSPEERISIRAALEHPFLC